MWPHTFTVLDFETTGLHPNRGDRVVEMGVARFERGELVETGNWLCNPTVHYPAKLAKMCQIDPKWLRDAPLFTECFQEAEPLFEDTTLVAYNAPFDRRFLFAELQHGGRSSALPPPLLNRWIDPRYLAQHFVRGLQNHKLTTVSAFFGIDLSQAHAALHDAVATGEVLKRIYEKHRGDALAGGLDALYEVQQLAAAAREAAYAGRKAKVAADAPILVYSCDGCHEFKAARHTIGVDSPWGRPSGWTEYEDADLVTCGVVCDFAVECQSVA